MTLPQHSLTVLPEWIDHNGHMNVAYYVLAFDLVTDELYETWQIGEAYDEAGYTLFTLGMNVDYLSELFEGTTVRVTSQLLDCDHKRIHYIHQMYHAETGVLAATNECLAINVSTATRRSAAFPDAVAANLQNILATHSQLETPSRAHRKLAIRRA